MWENEAVYCMHITHIYKHTYTLVAKSASRDRKACRNAPCMFGHPHMFESPLYAWTSPICLDAPRYVLMMFGCPLYIHNTKKACFVRLRGCPYAPIHLDAPCMFGCSLYVQMAPICLDTPHIFGCPLYVWMPLVCSDGPHMFGHPTYVWMPPVCLDSPHVWTPPYVWMPAVHI